MDRAFFIRLSREARAAISVQLRCGLTTENKGRSGFDPVTSADRDAERAIRALIEQYHPTDAIWGEEFGWSRQGAARVWSIDPIDGTRALICGLPSWSILTGVVDEGRHVAGMIDLPALDQTIVAIDGQTEADGKVARASSCSTIAEARLSTTDPHLFDHTDADGFHRVRRAARLTRYGLDALAYARLATGDLDLVIENGLKRHDYDAVVAVVRGAGGHIGDWIGGEDFTAGRIVAAATRDLYDEAVALLAP